MAPPLSLLVLAALTPDEHHVTVEDENVEKLDLRDAPDLVGITVKVDTQDRAWELATHYRRRGVPVVLGGIHVTACPESSLAYADAVVVGEAENIWPRLLDDLRAGRLQRLYRNDKPVDIAASPVPRWSAIRGKNYLFTNTLCIGRGCPWRCDFCYNSSPNIDARHRMKPISHILREIESLGTRHVMFIDDNFIGDPEEARQLLREFRKQDLTWHCAVSADIGRHDDILDLMAETGCKSLFIGFETVNPRNLRACRKTQNRVEQYNETIAKIHERGLMVNASLVFGFDNDTPRVFPETLDWLAANRVATMTAHILTPYPGTGLYNRLAAEGRILDSDFRHYNTAHAIFRPAGMTPDELENGFHWMYRKFYSWPCILRRMPLARSQTLAFLSFNLVYRKYGKLTCAMGSVFGMRNLAKLAKALAYPARRRSEPQIRRSWFPAWAR